MFDDTPGKAEVTFVGGLSAQGTYAAGVCGNNYCHGNGRTTGTYRVDGAATTCRSCHADATSGIAGWFSMSGKHLKHMSERVGCHECHAGTINASGAIVDAAKHVNGQKDVSITASGFTYSGGRCSGFCHGQFHFSERW
jgi:hypothetical protein